MQAQVNNTGLKATPVNPYLHPPASPHSDYAEENVIDYDKRCVLYHEFVAANPERDLTTPQEPNCVVDVEEVWQVRHRIGARGLNDNTNLTDWQQCSAEYYRQLSPTMDKELHRIAYKPITPPTPESDKGEGLEEDKFTNSPEWKAGAEFLDLCMVTGDDERFSRFYDFIAGWNACKSHHADPIAVERTVRDILTALRSELDKQYLPVIDGHHKSGIYKAIEIINQIKLIKP